MIRLCRLAAAACAVLVLAACASWSPAPPSNRPLVVLISIDGFRPDYLDRGVTPTLSKLAADGDPAAFAFPTAARVPGLDFSFAGLKTALLYAVRDLGDEAEHRRADLAASYQHAIVRALVDRCERALAQTGLHRLALGGGVAANGPLRERVRGLGVEVSVPPMELCTDNAAMIASAARWVQPVAYPAYLGVEAYASGERALA
jgi:N6-L-threonylcarbamoyladenine synthase